MSDAIAQQITVAPVLPAEPLVLCNASFLSTLAKVEHEIAHIEVKDGPSAQSAANLLQRLTAAGVALEKARTDLKAPFIAKGREIDEAARKPAGRIEDAKRGIKTKVTAFNDAQAEIARKAEVARQAELARLEKIRLQEVRADEEKAAALAAQIATAQAANKMVLEIPEFEEAPADGTIDYGPPKTETERQIEAVKFAPVVAAPKPVGIATRTHLTIESIDVAKLPEMFVIRTANEKALRATYCTGWKKGDAVPEVAGVAFKIVESVVSTGRNEF